MFAAGLSVEQIEAGLRAQASPFWRRANRAALGWWAGPSLLLGCERAGDVTFDQLLLKLAVVAVDLESESEVILDSGRCGGCPAGDFGCARRVRARVATGVTSWTAACSTMFRLTWLGAWARTT